MQRASARKQGKSRRRKSRLTPRAWQLIQSESRSLGVTDDEYVRLTASLFSQLRQAMAKKQTVDGKAMLRLVENPLFGAAIQYMASTVSDHDDTATSPQKPSTNSDGTGSPPAQNTVPPSLHWQTPQQPNPPANLHQPPSPPQPSPGQTLPPEMWGYW